MLIKSTFRNYHCELINKVVSLQLNWEDDPKANLITGAVIGDCNFAKACGVVDEYVGYDWGKCPVYGKRETFR